MIEQVLQEIRNYYLIDGVFGEKVEADGLKVSDAGIFMAGAYVYVVGSVMNDGVYKILSIDEATNKLTLEGALQAEMIERKYRVYLLGIPKPLIDLVDEISAYNTNNPNGVKSESLGDYSVSYGGSGEDGSWKSVFKSRLAPYRKAYLNLPSRTRW
jgi:hypothetical protein